MDSVIHFFVLFLKGGELLFLGMAVADGALCIDNKTVVFLLLSFSELALLQLNPPHVDLLLFLKLL